MTRPWVTYVMCIRERQNYFGKLQVQIMPQDFCCILGRATGARKTEITHEQRHQARLRRSTVHLNRSMCQEILRTEILRRCALQPSHNDIFLALRCQLTDEVDPDAPHAKREEPITTTENNECVGHKKADIFKREIGNVAVSLCELGSLHDKHFSHRLRRC